MGYRSFVQKHLHKSQIALFAFFYQQYSSTAWSFTFTLTAIYGVVFSSRIQNSNLNLLSLTQTSQGHLWLQNEKILQTEKWVYPTLYQSNIKCHLRNQIWIVYTESPLIMHFKKNQNEKSNKRPMGLDSHLSTRPYRWTY